MSDLDLTIELDPAPAATAAKKVVDEFGKAEDQGIKAKQAFESLSQTFRRLGQAMLEESRRGSQAIGNLGSAIARVARYQQILADEERKQTAAALGSVRAFDGMTEALRREQQMLDRIHGPMRQLQQDLQVLNKLEREGKISAEQRAAALLKSGAAAGIVTKSSSSGGVNVAGLDGIASDVGALKLSQVAQGASQAFELLNAQLHITNNALGNAVGSGIKFAALGAQIGGPWGAALGGLVGLTAALADELYDLIEGGAHARRMKALQDEIDVNKQLADSYASIRKELVDYRDGLVDLGFAQAKAHEDAIRAAHDQLNGGAVLDAREKIRQLTVALITVQRERESLNDSLPAGAFKSGVSDTEILLTRQLRDARIEAALATKTYGKTVADLKLDEQHHLDAQIDLKRALEAGDLTLKQYNAELAKLSGHASTATAGVARLRAQVEAVWGSPLGRLSDEEMAKPGIAGLLREQAEAERVAAVERAARYSYAANGAPVDQTSGFPTYAQAIASANAPAKELEEHVTSINDLFADQLVGSAKTFSDTLVDAANGAEVSWSSFGRNLLVTFEKMITQALVLKAITGSVTGTKGTDGWGGLIGALGFSTGGDALAGVSGLHRIPAAATGYDGIVPGAGSTDSRLAMIRVTPGESIHVRTPEQRRAASTPSGSTTIQNVFQFDKRSLLPILSSPDGKAAIVNVVRENPELMRALLR